MTEKERRELMMLGLDPDAVAQRVYSPEAKQWNPADYIGWSKQNDGKPAVYTNAVDTRQRLPEGSGMSDQERQALRQQMMNKLMTDQVQVGEDMEITAEPLRPAFDDKAKGYLKALGYDPSNFRLSEEDESLMDAGMAKKDKGQPVDYRTEMIMRALTDAYED